MAIIADFRPYVANEVMMLQQANLPTARVSHDAEIQKLSINS